MHGLDLLIFVACGDVLRALQGFLGLDGHFFKSQHIDLVFCHYLEKGAGTLASP